MIATIAKVWLLVTVVVLVAAVMVGIILFVPDGWIIVSVLGSAGVIFVVCGLLVSEMFKPWF